MLSTSLQTQLLEFRDDATPLGAAVWASNSVEIFCGRRPGQAYLFGSAFVCLCFALQYAHSWLSGEADGIMMRDLTGMRFGRVLWGGWRAWTCFQDAGGQGERAD